ncbi:MAG: transposase [Rhodanobacteraceae bacterium]
MTNYRRDRTAGGSYFFTLNLADRRSHRLVEHIELLRAAFRAVKATHPFVVDAIVVLPDHLHAVWTLPSNDADYALRWRLIKTRFSRSLPRGEPRVASRQGKGERGIWQRRYWEHRIRDDRDFAAHVDYVHINPVRHGLVAATRDWPYSSFRRYVREGTLAPDWAQAPDRAQSGSSFGERR